MAGPSNFGQLEYCAQTRTTPHTIRTTLDADLLGARLTPEVQSCWADTEGPNVQISNEELRTPWGTHLKWKEQRKPTEHIFGDLILAMRVNAQTDISI